MLMWREEKYENQLFVKSHILKEESTKNQLRVDPFTIVHITFNANKLFILCSKSKDVTYYMCYFVIDFK